MDFAHSPPFAKLHAYGTADGDVAARVGKQSRLFIAAEDLNLVAVAAAAEQETAVGRDVELARVGCSGLIADVCEQSRLLVDGKDGNAFGLQPVAGL